MDDFVAYPSRAKIVVLVLGCVGFVALGVWFTGLLVPPPGARRYSTEVVVLVGWTTILLFSGAGVVWLRRLFERREQLRIGHAGVQAAPWSDATIPWSEITDVTTWTGHGQTVIVLHLQDPSRFPGRGLAAATAAANRSFTGGDISISLAGTDRSAFDALAVIERFRT